MTGACGGPAVPDRIEDVAAAIAARLAGRRLLLLTDFDGTLCEFHPTPETVRLPPARRDLLAALAARDATVGIISGRRIEDLRARAGLGAGVYYAGLHGLEIAGDEARFVHDELPQTRGLLQVLARSLAAHAAALPGVWVENKDLSVTLHLRDAARPSREAAEHLLARMAGDHFETGLLRLMPGDGVYELLPNIAWNKGDAAVWIRQDVERRWRTPACSVYLGDDVTDEDAIRRIGPDGVTIKVGVRPTAAAFRLADPSAVERLLRRLVVHSVT